MRPFAAVKGGVDAMDVGSNYSEALERQVAMVRFLASPVGKWAFDNAPAGDERLRREDEELSDASSDEMRQSVSRWLSHAETFYWAADTCRLLRAGMDSLEEWTLDREALVAGAGFCWFSSPLPMGEFGGVAMTCRAMAWERGTDERGREVVGLTWFVPTVPSNGLPIWGMPVGMMPWYPGESIAAALGRYPGAGLEHQAFTRMQFRCCAAATLFLQQRILVAPHRSAQRHAAKRVAREGWTHEPLIRVVQLRRSAPAGYTPPGEHEAREWACQWIVRGHWRQQACGAGRQERRPIWIMPHVKGPEDKPLKAPRATVFAVVR